jgi:hypothetical protein
MFFQTAYKTIGHAAALASCWDFRSGTNSHAGFAD